MNIVKNKIIKCKNIDFYVDHVGWNKGEWRIPENGFIFPCPAGVSPPAPEKGSMMCMPYLIKTAEELKKVEKAQKLLYFKEFANF